MPKLDGVVGALEPDFVYARDLAGARARHIEDARIGRAPWWTLLPVPLSRELLDERVRDGDRRSAGMIHLVPVVCLPHLYVVVLDLVDHAPGGSRQAQEHVNAQREVGRVDQPDARVRHERRDLGQLIGPPRAADDQVDARLRDHSGALEHRVGRGEDDRHVGAFQRLVVLAEFGDGGVDTAHDVVVPDASRLFHRSTHTAVADQRDPHVWPLSSISEKCSLRTVSGASSSDTTRLKLTSEACEIR